VAPGTVGELYIGGLGVARGYLNRPQLTQAHFLPDPFADRPDARLYRTGDLARCSETGDGVLEYLGRVDHQVKIQGYRIELGEIEYALASHPKVRACAVLVQDTNPVEKALIAFVVPQGGSLDTGSLMKDLGEQLPHYMKPSRIIAVENLPLTSNGKIDRHVLLAMTGDEMAEGHQAIEQPAPQTPRTRTETLVTNIFEEVLQRSDVELSADFFDLGGRSLSATRLMMKLRTATGMDLPLRMLYENPSIEKLAAELDARIWAAAPATNAAPDQSREALTL
jgi:acyl carrier protein